MIRVSDKLGLTLSMFLGAQVDGQVNVIHITLYATTWRAMHSTAQ